jgi:hypothetical protein
MPGSASAPMGNPCFSSPYGIGVGVTATLTTQKDGRWRFPALASLMACCNSHHLVHEP